MQQAMQKHRSGEEQAMPFRHDRFSCINGDWYFEARGGVQMGPYANREEVESGLKLYIHQQTMRNPVARR